MRAGDLCDGVVAVLREPFRIEGLGTLIVENVLEPMVRQESNGFFQFFGQSTVLAVHDRIDVFPQQYLEQRTCGTACTRAKRARDFRGKIAQNRHYAVGVGCECPQEMPVAIGPVAGREIRLVVI